MGSITKMADTGTDGPHPIGKSLDKKQSHQVFDKHPGMDEGQHAFGGGSEKKGGSLAADKHGSLNNSSIQLDQDAQHTTMNTNTQYQTRTMVHDDSKLSFSNQPHLQSQSLFVHDESQANVLKDPMLLEGSQSRGRSPGHDQGSTSY